ncbi:ankyrin repeat-containing domain, PGG domain protein [Tanacetum coccineum]|uniref:Ankyrin repeat-containing domain, PGG domain protein n=1 Tax=Tanacetum coccineum TaxID=301880 RepID=A0ABQ5HEW1_9ASTR
MNESNFIPNVGEAFPYRSHVIGPNFVTLKLSSKIKYNLWRMQMECLIKSQHMVGFIEGQFPSSVGNGKEKVEDVEAWIAGDSLVKGWILGSLSEEVVNTVVNHLTHKKNNIDFTAKDLWDELQLSYGPSVREQLAELPTRQTDFAIEVSSIYEDYNNRRLYKSVLEGNTDIVIDHLEKVGRTPWDKLRNNGNTVLHVAVGSSIKNHELLKKLLDMTPKGKTLLDLINSDGSTLLHVAAIGGNIEVVDMLVKRNPELLLATDKEGHTPLALSVSNMHTKTSQCLFEHMKAKGYDALFCGKSGEDIVVLAISCQDFRLANMIIDDYPEVILFDSDALLTELTSNFPRELNFWERGRREELHRILASHSLTDDRINKYLKWPCGSLLLEIFLIFIIEKIYNLLYEMKEDKNIYKTIKDSFGNNLLHLAARLAPTNKLNLISGAALQIQRELQWFKEVERFVWPLNRIQKNSDNETPQMVFTREHKNLVAEGENWTKKTAESYTITAALIITIVFAAAITVPGGNNQDSGIPIFINNTAFTVFAISDAISLFTAVTSLLMFLSILTARFAEQDFLFKLPTKLIIGLTMLFLSTTAMIIAFGASLFLVFGQSNLLMLIPIGALTCLPVTSFVTLQFPLIEELISATYCGGIFVREKYDYFY